MILKEIISISNYRIKNRKSVLNMKKAASAAGPEAKQALLDFFALGSIYSACFE
ncbi:hypothetical protein B4077_1125 [Bacillus cereus]|uniref:Uncharacterized protein n=1 Tax=Bacillus cereus TaxID=1396 RepID=A0A0G8EBQ7_BACCE|nr:hypothetical protein B4077_1125 [Bacillus cereus]